LRENDWQECLINNSSVEITPDFPKVKSLQETAEGRINFLKEVNIDENNASYVFENFYSSVLEYLHALLISKGFKVRNHICSGYYLRDIIKREDLFRLFDDCRYKRNSLVYYGKKLDLVIAKESINKCKQLIIELKKLI
jgi:hypothetical protein